MTVQGGHQDTGANHVTVALNRAGVNPSLTLQREQKSSRGEAFSKSETTNKHFIQGTNKGSGGSFL